MSKWSEFYGKSDFQGRRDIHDVLSGVKSPYDVQDPDIRQRLLEMAHMPPTREELWQRFGRESRPEEKPPMREADLLLEGAQQAIRALDALTAEAEAGHTVRLSINGQEEPAPLHGERLHVRLGRERAAVDSETLLSIAANLSDLYSLLEAVLERLPAPVTLPVVLPDTDAAKRERDPLGEWYPLGSLSVDKALTELARCPLTLGHSDHRWWNTDQDEFTCPGVFEGPPE